METDLMAASPAYIAFFHARLKEMENDKGYYAPELRARMEANKEEMRQEIALYEAEMRRRARPFEILIDMVGEEHFGILLDRTDRVLQETQVICVLRDLISFSNKK